MDSFKIALSLEPENEEALDGLRRTHSKIRDFSSGGDNAKDEEASKRALADPEIQMLLHDPSVNAALEQCQANPADARRIFNDVNMGPKLQKLVNAGVLRIG